MADNNQQAGPETNEALMQRLEALEAGHAALQKENEALRKGLKTAEQPAAQKPKPVIPSETFQVAGREYKFIAPAFRHAGVDMTAKDALADVNVLKALVATNSGIIAEVV